MIEVTFRSMRDDLFTIVKRKGADFIYEPPPDHGMNCAYWHEDGPGCMFGCWFDLRGITQQVTLQCGIENSGDDIEAALIRLDAEGIISLGDHRIKPYAKAMQAAQDDQDNRTPWGEVLAVGDVWLRHNLTADELGLVLL